MIVEHGMLTRQTYAQCHHHKGNLRDSGEGKHTLDITLGTGNGCGIESGEDTYPYHNAQLRLRILNPQGEHTGDLEHTSNDHRCGVNQRADWCRTLHGIGQPDMQREHRTLTGTTNEHQHQCRRQDEASCGKCLGGITLNKRRGALAHHDISREGETERVSIIAEEQDTYQEEHIREACHDERLLRGCDGRLQRIVESNQQIRGYTHQLPEGVHLEDIRGDYQAQHRHGEQAQERIVALEALLTVHIAERVDMHHQRYCRDDNEHHHGDGV